MLARPGDSHGNIEVRCDGLAGKAYLVAVIEPPCIAHGAGSAHCTSQQLRQIFKLVERLGSSKPPSAANDYSRVLQPHALRLLSNGFHKPRPNN